MYEDKSKVDLQVKGVEQLSGGHSRRNSANEPLYTIHCAWTARPGSAGDILGETRGGSLTRIMTTCIGPDNSALAPPASPA